MSSPTIVLAFDFGASSGRAIKAVYKDGKLSYEEIHRFDNLPHEYEGHFCWDFEALMKEVHIGLQKAGNFDSVGFDTWGVDFGLLGEDGKLLSRPVHYRDGRTGGLIQEAEKKLPAEVLYAETGVQIMGINTFFQLLALKKQQPKVLEQARRLLFMPDLFSVMLGGKPVCERSIASTSQMLDPRIGLWSGRIEEVYGISTELFPPLVDSGTITGTLPNGAKIIAVAGHDTQCAVAAMPCVNEEEPAAFLSCGTWSLLGTELLAPILSPESCRAGLSNEMGANGRVNYLKNITGLWLIQESRRQWRRQGKEYSYAQLEELALEAPALRCFIDPDAPEFTPAGDIPERIQEFCSKTGQQVPETVGEVMRCIYQSLAFKYRFALQQLSQMTGKAFSVLHMLGGGAKDRLLCRLTADCCGIPVVAGPIEATALGNIIIQLKALGALESIQQGRELIARTEAVTRYEPQFDSSWDDTYEHFKKILI